jgi:hypothetical protein
MRIFISWSGDKSRYVALLLEEWIKIVIQASDPWVSTNIERGALWFSEISEQLASVSLGIICLTADNKEKPWILFEAGALAKGLQTNRVCTFLIDLKNVDIGQPLAQFNHTEPTKESVFQLMNTINNQLGDKKLPQHILEKTFEKNWSEFEERFRIINESYGHTDSHQTKRESNDILLELLKTVRSFDSRLQMIEQANEFSTPAAIKKQYQTHLIHDLIREYRSKGWGKNEVVMQLFNNHKVFSDVTLKKMVEDIWNESTIENN